MMLKSLLVLCFVAFAYATDPPQQCMKNHEVLNKIFKDYDKTESPRGVVNIGVAMWLQDIEYICPTKGNGVFSIYMTSKWHDERLDFRKMRPCNVNISIASEQSERLWNPRMAVIDSRKYEIHKTPDSAIFVMIFQNGTVWTCTRAKLTLKCKFDDNKEKATCSFLQESYAGNIDMINLSWDSIYGPFMALPSAEGGKWKLTKHTTKSLKPVYPGGVWPEVQLILEFEKEKTY